MKRESIIIFFIIFAIFSSQFALAVTPPVQTSTNKPVVDYLRINSDVKNGYAITTVEEKLSNTMGVATTDEFKFVIPEEAFISGFSLIIEGKEYKADVLPKEEAKEKFEKAASKGESAGLVEAKKKNMFSYSLSFEPGQSIIVRLTYEQAVKKSLGEYEYVLFLSSTDMTHSINDLSVNLSIESENEITTLEAPGFTEAKVKYLSTTRGEVRYNSKKLPDKDLAVVFTTNNPPIDGDMLFYLKGNQGYMMHVFSPGENDLGTTALSKDIIFVIDKSGSMSGDKITNVKQVFTDIISDLPPDDHFNVIFFDSTIRSYASMLMEANTKNKADAANFVNSLDASGGTNINDAMLQALGMFKSGSERVPIIVFLTDGEPTEGITSPFVIRKNVKESNKAEVSVFTIAFGIEDENNYRFLKGLSYENYGKTERFYEEENVEVGIVTFYKTISTPLITDMVFSYTGPVSDIVNTGESSLFAGSDAIVLARYQPGTGTISSDITAITRTGSRDFKKQFAVVSRSENDFIPRLWAYTKIGKLLEQIDVEGETDTLVSEVTRLSIDFKFVTPYTSLFVEVPSENKLKASTSEPVDARAYPEYAETGIAPGVTTPMATGTVVPGVTAPPAAVTVRKTPAETVAAPPMERTQPPRRSYPSRSRSSSPGFEAVFTIAGILSISYLIVRKRK